MLNVKYENLSKYGKIWTIREMFDEGLRLYSDLILFRANQKLIFLSSEMKLNNENLDCILTDVMNLRTSNNVKFNSDGSIISAIWENKGKLDKLQNQIREAVFRGTQEQVDIKTMGEEIKSLKQFFVGLYSYALRKKFLKQEKNDIYKMIEQTDDLQIKITKKILTFKNGVSENG